ncbi:MAG: hypothetical protein U0900_04490 [Myxococcota bacterium]
MRWNPSFGLPGRSCSLVAGLAIATALVAGGAGAARAEQGLRVELEFFEGDGEAPTRFATVLASGRRVRIEQRTPGAAAATAPTFIYRGDRDRLYSIADEARSYVELEPMLLSLLAGQTRVARREVSGSLEGLPRDQQRAVGHLLGVDTIDPKRPEDPLVFTRTGEEDQVAGIPCRRVELARSNRLLAKGCVADWATVGLTAADVEVFRSLAAFVREAAGSHAPIPVELVPGQPLDLVVQLGGFPLAFERAGRAAGASAIRVAAVEATELAAARFEVPSGYAARSGVAGIASLAGLLSIQSGPPQPGVPTAEDAGSAPALPAAPDPAAFEPAATSSGRPALRPIRLFDDAE